ncbi:MAG: EcsC family protein [Myxococcales bacterium]|nr:EcsC family protein [Myxococcales bacterium]
MLSAADRALVAEAARILENPSFLLRASDLLGKPAESLMKRLPAPAQRSLSKAVQGSLDRALHMAIASLDVPTPGLAPVTVAGSAVDASDAVARTYRHGQWHTAASAAVGFAGGFFGLAGLSVELPLTTAVMLRSIAAIARELGEDLTDPAVRLECLSVLALGSKLAAPIDAAFVDDAGQPIDAGAHGDSAYWTARVGMALAVRSAARYVAGRSTADMARAMAEGSAPLLVKLVTLIAARFQVVVSEKTVAQALPVIGAASGAALNAAFSDHFNRVARLHFGLRRLERSHGTAAVRTEYLAAVERQKADGR